MDLVETLVEVVKHLEFVLGVVVEALDLFYFLFGLSLTIWVGLVEGKHLFLFGFKFSAEFRSFEDPFTEILVVLEGLHAGETVG